MKYYDTRIHKNTALVMTHIERDSDCNGNEKGNSKKQMGGRPKIKNNMQNRERERDRQTDRECQQANDLHLTIF